MTARPPRSALALALALALPGAPAPSSPAERAASASGIAWRSDFETALAEAAERGTCVFVAINMDGERANDEAARELYRDRRLVELSEYTVALVASANDHGAADRPCPRFGSVHCPDHQAIERIVRERVLRPEDGTTVIAPQHLFLNLKGEVLLSVPYAISQPELEWCFLEALAAVGVELDWKRDPQARAPKRLVRGGVADPSRAERPLTREELLDLIERIRAGRIRPGERRNALLIVMRYDEPEAIDLVRTELRRGGGSSPAGRGGGRAGGTGGGRGTAKHLFLRAIGILSPPSYWEVVVEYIDHSDAQVRHAAAVALEQLGAPEATRAARSALSREKDPLIERALLRAVASCGATERRTREWLLSQSRKAKDPLLRANAIVGLGYAPANPEVDARLEEIARDEQSPDRAAAVLAMALSRRAEWAPLLAELAGPPEPPEEGAGDEGGGPETPPPAGPEDAEGEEEAGGAPTPLAAVARIALRAVRSGDLAPAEPLFAEICGDEIPRARLFGVREL